MKTAQTITLTLLLAAWATVAAASPAPEKKNKGDAPQTTQADEDSVESTAEPTLEDSDALGPIGVFADIEEGWRKEDTDKILGHFGKGKVGMSIDGVGPAGGAFSKNQSHYLFKDLFKYTITKKFEFVQYRNVSDGKVKVFAVAERSYKRNDDGRLFKDKIYVSLHLEDDRWVISEIKSIR